MSYSQHYYYIDPSCGENFEALFERAQSFAARALERLEDRDDKEFAKVFKLIFKTSIGDTEPMARSEEYEPPGTFLKPEAELRPRPVVDHVRRELYSLAHRWTRTMARAGAEVRLHWDGTGRYVEHRPEVFFDPVNFMVRHCSRGFMEGLFRDCEATVMLHHPVELRLIPEDQHPRRVVIDLTERARRKQIPWAACAGAGLNGLHVDDFGHNLIEITLIHEMMHCSAYRLLDFCDENQGTSGWHLIAGLSKECSYLCAESIAMLCLAAALADLKPTDLPSGYRYTLSRNGKITAYQEASSECTPA